MLASAALIFFAHQTFLQKRSLLHSYGSNKPLWQHAQLRLHSNDATFIKSKITHSRRSNNFGDEFLNEL